MDLFDGVEAIGEDVGEFVVITALLIEKVGIVTADLNSALTGKE